MQIKGVTDVVRLPRLGKLRLGVKKENPDGTIYLSPTDCFVCPEEVRKVFGDHPKVLCIMFPTEDESQWANLFLRCYSASRDLICRGDGETALTGVDNETGAIAAGDATVTRLREIACNPDTCAYYRQGQCQWVMNLQFLIPDCPGFGVYQLVTSSPYSILNINLSLGLIRSINDRLAMIPLCLRLEKHEVKPNVNKKTERFLRLTVCHSAGEIKKNAQTPGGQTLILPPPDSEPPDDLFPEASVRASETVQKPTDPDEKLLDLWARIKNKIWHFEIQDSQIANWFEKNCHLEVRLLDFDPPVPPAKLTAEILSAFCQSIDRYAGR